MPFLQGLDICQSWMTVILQNVHTSHILLQMWEVMGYIDNHGKLVNVLTT